MNLSGVLSYVGPGPGLTMLWAFLGLLGTIALAVLSLLIWPIRMMIRKMRRTTPPTNENAPQEPSAPNSDARKISQ